MKVQDLSSIPDGWIARWRSIFASCPAPLGIVVHQGQVKIAICNGN